jgi:hypothetical protein
MARTSTPFSDPPENHGAVGNLTFFAANPDSFKK